MNQNKLRKLYKAVVNIVQQMQSLKVIELV